MDASSGAFAILFQHSLDGVLLSLADGRICAANHAACRMLRRSEEELRGLERVALVDSASLASSAAFAEGGASGGARVELYLRRGDGTRVLVEVTAAPFADEEGQQRAVTILRELSEQRPGEAAPRWSPARFELLAAAAPVGIFAADARGYCTYVNERWCEYAGMKAREALGSGWMRALHPEDREWVTAAWYEAAARQENFSREYRFRRPDGRSFLLLGTAAVLRSELGEHLGFVGAVVDLTERKRAEDLLRTNEERLRGLLEHAPLPYALNDPEGRISYLNPAFVRTFGYDLSDLRTVDDWWPLAYPDAAYRAQISGEWERRLERSRREGVDFEPFEARIRCKDGSTRTVLAWAHSIGAGLLGTHAVVLYDLTERVRIEEELRLAAAITENMVEGASLVRAVDGTLFHATARFAKLFGYSLPELLERPLDALLAAPEREGAAFLAEVRERIASDGFWRGELRNRRRDGTEFWSLASVSPLKHAAHGDVWVVLHEDITQWKLAEEARFASQRLEALGTLAGGIAHDFNNILMALQGNVDVLELEVPPSPLATTCLTELKRGCARAAELVRRITTFGRPNEEHRRALKLPPVVEEVLRLLRSAVPARIRLLTRFEEPLDRVFADAGQVHEALVNLTTNAVDAIGERSGAVEFALQNVELSAADAATYSLPAGRYVLATVRDDGAGMDAETRRRVFDAFFTTKRMGKGTGLGLSMVYGIMKSHEGAVAIESTPGVGTAVSLYFPTAPGTHGESARVEYARHAASPGRRILLLDDEEMVLRVLQQGLSLLQHSVTAFTDPLLAVEHFRQHPQDFDVVVTDLSTPTLSGVEVARAILAVRGDIPVILSSGHTDLDVGHVADAAGIRELVSKPIALTELVRAIERQF